MARRYGANRMYDRTALVIMSLDGLVEITVRALSMSTSGMPCCHTRPQSCPCLRLCTPAARPLAPCAQQPVHGCGERQAN